MGDPMRLQSPSPKTELVIWVIKHRLKGGFVSDTWTKRGICLGYGLFLAFAAVPAAFADQLWDPCRPGPRPNVCSRVVAELTWTSKAGNLTLSKATALYGLGVECEFAYQCRANVGLKSSTNLCPEGTQLDADAIWSIPFRGAPLGAVPLPPFQVFRECRDGKVTYTELGFPECPLGFEDPTEACWRSVNGNLGSSMALADYLCADSFDLSVYTDAPKYQVVECRGQCAGTIQGQGGISTVLSTAQDSETQVVRECLTTADPVNSQSE